MEGKEEGRKMLLRRR